MTGVQGNALKCTSIYLIKKFFFKFPVQVLWKWVINILVCFSVILVALFELAHVCTASREDLAIIIYPM